MNQVRQKNKPIQCKECGVSFTPLHFNRKFCTDSCAKAHNGRLYYSRHKLKQNARTKNWYLNNKEKHNAHTRDWHKKHPAYINASSTAYRLRKKNQMPKSLSKKHIEDIKQFYICAQLFSQSGIKFSVDHIVPLNGKNVSGLHVPWNLQVMPLRDNISKGNKF